MKIGVVGSRTFTDYPLMCGVLHRFLEDLDEIISGGANGADTLAEAFADEEGIKCTVFKPNWELYGIAAGFLRNQQIVDACDILVAFWDGKSKGTKDSINKAKKAKKPTLVVYF